MKTIRFIACKELDFDQSKYTAKLALIQSGGITKLVWERHDPDGNLQLCQFCKRNGRHNRADSCLDMRSAECPDYTNFEHIIELEEDQP